MKGYSTRKTHKRFNKGFRNHVTVRDTLSAALSRHREELKLGNGSVPWKYRAETPNQAFMVLMEDGNDIHQINITFNNNLELILVSPDRQSSLEFTNRVKDVLREEKLLGIGSISLTAWLLRSQK